MAEEIKKVISIDTKGAETVKDLIDKVEKLRGILKTLDETSDEYKTTLGELKAAQDSLSSSLGENKTKAEAAEGSYNALAQQMKVLKKEWKATSDEAERNALGKEIKGINDQLKTLDQSIGNNQRNVGNYAGSFQSLKQEIREARDVMAAAARGSDEYAEAAKRAAEASAKLRDMQEEIVKGDAGLDNQFAVTSNLLGSISGGFAAAQGAMALFGAESENLQKTFVKLQAAMSMTQGFKALAELPKGLNAAKIAFGGVTTGVKNFIKGLNGVKGAIAATGIGILLVLLGELIAHWDEVTEAVSNFVGGIDHLKEVMAGVGNSIGQFIMGPLRALDLALNKDFKGAWEAFKNGWKFAENYAVGVQNQMIRNQQKATQTQIELEDDRLRNYIEDMEAKKKADWKYSAEGIDAYRKYHLNRLKMFKEGTEEYRKAQREMWSYERDLKEWRDRQKSGGSGGSGNSGKSEADKAAEEAAKWREELEEAQKKGRDAMNELLSDAYQKRLKAYRDSITEVGQGIQKAFEVEPLLRRNDEVLSKAKGILGKYSADIAKAYDYNLGLVDVFYSAINTKNQVVLDGELKVLKDKLPAGVFEIVEKAAGTLMKGSGAALDEYTKLIIKGVDNLTEEEKKTFDIYKELIAESQSIGNIAEADIQGYSDSVRKLTKDYYKEMELLSNFKKKYEEEEEKFVKRWGDLIDAETYHTQTTVQESLEAELTNFSAFYRDYEAKQDGFQKKWRDFWGIIGTDTSELTEIAEKWEEILNEEGTIFTKKTALLETVEDSSMIKRKKILSAFFDWRSEEDRNRFFDQKELIKNELLENTMLIDSKIAGLQAEKALYEAGSKEIDDINKEITQLQIDRSNLVTEAVIKNKEVELEEYRTVERGKQQLAQKTGEVLGNVGDFLMNQSDILTKKYKKDGEWQNKEKEKQAERMFNTGKALAISEAVISTYQGAQEAFTSLAGIPYVGPALGIAAAAAAITAGMLRIQSIASQKFGDDGNVSDASSSVGITSAVAVPQLESTPYSYTSTITDAKDEDELNKPTVVLISDVEDAMKVRESRQVETSF